MAYLSAKSPNVSFKPPPPERAAWIPNESKSKQFSMYVRDKVDRDALFHEKANVIFAQFDEQGQTAPTPKRPSTLPKRVDASAFRKKREEMQSTVEALL